MASGPFGNAQDPNIEPCATCGELVPHADKLVVEKETIHKNASNVAFVAPTCKWVTVLWIMDFVVVMDLVGIALWYAPLDLSQKKRQNSRKWEYQ
uniref:Uncharacterized protein n=1 Tax=Ditylenchus dipsaci TaxID=166011 RepID=A0A915CXD5_9BILA